MGKVAHAVAGEDPDGQRRLQPGLLWRRLYRGQGQLLANTAARHWSAEDIKRIKQSLAHMNDEGAVAQWRRIESFGIAGLDRIASYK
jgi:hypothetical protein